jgi:hypothetical protein
MMQLEWLIKGLQEETANGASPAQANNGWQWQSSDPDDLVEHDWGGLWNATSPSDRAVLTGDYLRAWLAQASKYSPQQYYAGGWASTSDNLPSMISTITFGGAMWQMLPRLRYYGIDSTIISQYYTFVAAIWPHANWSANKTATCWANGPGAQCSTD